MVPSSVAGECATRTPLLWSKAGWARQHHSKIPRKSISKLFAVASNHQSIVPKVRVRLAWTSSRYHSQESRRESRRDRRCFENLWTPMLRTHYERLLQSRRKGSEIRMKRCFFSRILQYRDVKVAVTHREIVFEPQLLCQSATRKQSSARMKNTEQNDDGHIMSLNHMVSEAWGAWFLWNSSAAITGAQAWWYHQLC